MHSVGTGTPETFSSFSVFEVLMLGIYFLDTCCLLSVFQSALFLLCPGHYLCVSFCMCSSVNAAFTEKHKSSLGNHDASRKLQTHQRTQFKKFNLKYYMTEDPFFFLS